MHGDLSMADRLLRDKDWIARTPGLANGGIALAVVEPDTVGWSKIASLLDDYGFIAFASADKQTVFDQIRKRLGDEGDLPYWDSFTASASVALSASDGIIQSGKAHVLTYS